ncbi:hypothetical protein B296_00007702 [Ensete ventricosum]|uniref:Uncharacterized protein n=1 Tax=Ensete ventricosum TaxID=4639 RepID=A0A426ZHC3_ENSVE|nr:hypothetical protein B296_00007702 [Ensete ventricosum]
MIRVAEDLDCSSGYIRLRGLDKSEDKIDYVHPLNQKRKRNNTDDKESAVQGGVSEPGAVCVPATTTACNCATYSAADRRACQEHHRHQGGARMEERGDRRGGVKEGGAVVQEEKEEKGACDAEGGRGGEYR